MKISPIASNPPPASSEIGTAAHSPDAVARAKAAFAGVQVSSSDTPQDPTYDKIRSNIRTLKMKTNASPERYLQEVQANVPQENAISPTGEKTNATLEATQPLSPQYVALAKQRRALQVKERELAARQAALTSEAPRTGQEDVIARLKEQPLKVLQEAGVTYEQLTEAILANQTSNPEIQALKDEINSLKAGVESRFTEQTTQSEQQVLSEMKKEALELSKQGEEFSLVRETNSIPDVMSLIERTYRETGEVLEVQEALTLIEGELMKEATKIANYTKIKSSLAPAPQPQQQSQLRQMRTLTNRDTATLPMSAKARAIAAFRGELKK